MGVVYEKIVDLLLEVLREKLNWNFF